MAHDNSIEETNHSSVLRATTMTLLRGINNPLRTELASLFFPQRASSPAAKVVEGDIVNLGNSFDKVTFENVNPSQYFISIKKANKVLTETEVLEGYNHVRTLWNVLIQRVIARRLKSLELNLEIAQRNQSESIDSLVDTIEQWIIEGRKAGVPENILLVSLYGTNPRVNTMLVKGAPPLTDKEKDDYSVLAKYKRFPESWYLATHARLRLLHKSV